jgi:primosomal protein N' (replication factor Y)
VNRYCDVALPVPLDQAFTYELPDTMRQRVQPGCRVTVPFGQRKLVGVVLRAHDDPPAGPLRQALQLLDEEPVLPEELMKLGEWTASYYCAPLGETLRSMIPLAGEIRRGKTYSLTQTGRDAARQMLIGETQGDTVAELLRMLEARPLSAAYLSKKFEKAGQMLRELEKKGFVSAEEVAAERDPLRLSSERLRIRAATIPEGAKLNKAERELIAFLSLHPGTHNLAQVDAIVKGASPAARALARKGWLDLHPEAVESFTLAGSEPRVLNAQQQAAFRAIRDAMVAGRFTAFLLHGVTGSGKTEVYLQAIEAALALGRAAMLLVPEIALTPAMAGQFHTRFAGRVAILHSAFPERERAQEWRRIRSGAAGVVVATRSGVFAPVRNLGLIVVDEEHDSSYKQQETPRYNGRDLAVVRAQAAGAVVVLGSATPSVESRYNAERGKYALLEMPERIEQRPLPVVHLVDMRQEFLETKRQAIFSRALVDAVRDRLEQREQAMLLMNRRGFSSFVLCRACGERVECPQCSVALTYHRRDRRLLCHYCGWAERVPERCTKCDSGYLQFVGAGAEKVEDELRASFPAARIARLDRDTVGGRQDLEQILGGFREGAFDILVGTQMIAKGHDIPNVTLVGVVNADIGLGLPDFRAAERTFQLLTQAAGRAGRGGTPGTVYIQTNNPEHWAIRLAAEQDYARFYERELEFRRLLRYPPFVALANLLVRHAEQREAMRMSGEIANLLDPAPEGMKVLGPAEAPVAKLKNEFRYQMLIKSKNRRLLGKQLQRIRHHAQEKRWNATALVIDVDPVSLL